MAVISDDTWKCRLSSERHLGDWTNSNFGGDQIDATKELPGWNHVGLDDSGWEHATAYDLKRTLSPDLVAQTANAKQSDPLA